MAILKVPDKSTGKVVNIKIDQEDLDRLKKYEYTIDHNHAKPFREEKINGLVRRVFLARDVKNFKFGDGKVVSYRNNDMYDCRKENLVEGRTRIIKAANGNYWPLTFKALMNFLDRRTGPDEDLTASFLAKALDVKYSRKRLGLLFDAQDYQEYQDKKIQLVMLRTFNQHFEWGGQILVAKQLTENIGQKIQSTDTPEVHINNMEKGNEEAQQAQQPLEFKPRKPRSKTPKISPLFAETFEKVKVEKERVDAMESTACNIVSIESYRHATVQLLDTHKDDLFKILREVLPFEELIRIVAERLSPNLSMMIQSK